MSFNVTILGSSGALPAYGRFPSCQLVEIENRYFLIDCGEGAQIQLMKYQTNFHRISHIFISHLHGDHYLGLMGLLFTMHLLRRTNEIHIHGHAGLDEIITTQLKYSRSVPSYPIHFHLLPANGSKIIFEDNHLTVETLPLRHKLLCTGFLFREKIKPRRVNKETLPPGLLIQQIANLKRGFDVTDEHGNVLYKNEELTLAPRRSRSFAYCSDTAYNEALVEKLKDVHLLFHEATFTKDEQSKATETLHSTAEQAGRIAKMANVDRLVIGHFSARYKDLSPVLEEAKTVFANTYLANEGEIFSIAD
jgi:ribonuclease Z